MRGRFFSDMDGPNSPLVTMVDETAAHRYWPNEDPVGKRLKGFDARGKNDDWLTVTGVVQDMRRHGREQALDAHIFQWYRQAPDNGTPDLW